MRLHPSTLIDNEQYIIEIKNKTNDITHVYKGKRKVTLIDKINEEGIYHSVWFIDLDLIYSNPNIKLKAPKLKRNTNMCYNELEYNLFRQNGKDFKLCDDEEEQEEIRFYDCGYYEKCVLPKLEQNNTNNLTNIISNEDLLSSV